MYTVYAQCPETGDATWIVREESRLAARLAARTERRLGEWANVWVIDPQGEEELQAAPYGRRSTD